MGFLCMQALKTDEMGGVGEAAPHQHPPIFLLWVGETYEHAITLIDCLTHLTSLVEKYTISR
jgi:hypothetical protein